MSLEKVVDYLLSSPEWRKNLLAALEDSEVSAEVLVDIFGQCGVTIEVAEILVGSPGLLAQKLQERQASLSPSSLVVEVVPDEGFDPSLITAANQAFSRMTLVRQKMHDLLVTLDLSYGDLFTELTQFRKEINGLTGPMSRGRQLPDAYIENINSLKSVEIEEVGWIDFSLAMESGTGDVRAVDADSVTISRNGVTLKFNRDGLAEPADQEAVDRFCKGMLYHGKRLSYIDNPMSVKLLRYFMAGYKVDKVMNFTCTGFVGSDHARSVVMGKIKAIIAKKSIHPRSKADSEVLVAVHKRILSSWKEIVAVKGFDQLFPEDGVPIHPDIMKNIMKAAPEWYSWAGMRESFMFHDKHQERNRGGLDLINSGNAYGVNHPSEAKKYIRLQCIARDVAKYARLCATTHEVYVNGLQTDEVKILDQLLAQHGLVIANHKDGVIQIFDAADVSNSVLVDFTKPTGAQQYDKLYLHTALPPSRVPKVLISELFAKRLPNTEAEFCKADPSAYAFVTLHKMPGLHNSHFLLIAARVAESHFTKEAPSATHTHAIQVGRKVDGQLIENTWYVQPHPPPVKLLTGGTPGKIMYEILKLFAPLAYCAEAVVNTAYTHGVAPDEDMDLIKLSGVSPVSYASAMSRNLGFVPFTYVPQVRARPQGSEVVEPTIGAEADA